jgi:hypothetical protein
MKNLLIVLFLLSFIALPAYAQDPPKKDEPAAKKAEPKKLEPKKEEVKKEEPTTRPTAGPTLPDDVPADAAEAVELAKKGYSYAKAKNWWAMCAVIIWVIMFVLKMFKLFKKMGKRWAYITVGALSMAAMLLAKFGAGVSWEAAVAVFTSGPFMAFANDFVKRGLLGKEPETPVKPNGAG